MFTRRGKSTGTTPGARPRLAIARAVTERPVLAAALSLLTVGLVLLIITATLPYALARSQTALALHLNSRNPSALQAEAARLRDDLARLMSQPDKQAEAAKRLGDGPDWERQIADLKVRLTAAARQLAQHDPFNAKAYRMLATATDDSAAKRQSMQTAVALSRRERTAMLWLVHDSYEHGDPAALLAYADMLMRTNAGFARHVIDYLIHAQNLKEGREHLLTRLVQSPPWRPAVLEWYAARTKAPDGLISLLAALNQRAAPATADEVVAIIDALFRRGEISVAHALWRQRIGDDGAKPALLNNGGFERQPDGLAFDWRIREAVNAIVERARDTRTPDNNALHLAFAGRRARDIEVAQVIVAPPGRYALTGRMRGIMTSKRGLIWQVQCLAGQPVKGETIARSHLIQPKTAAWQPFSFEFTIPADRACAAQRIALGHDARSASERLISGEAWVDDLDLRRAGPEPPPSSVLSRDREDTPPLNTQPEGGRVAPKSLVSPLHKSPTRRFEARPAGP